MKANARLYTVFSICHELGIDDPIHWMNNTKPVLVDWWTSYLCVKSERENPSSSENGKELSPEEALEQLSKHMSK